MAMVENLLASAKLQASQGSLARVAALCPKDLVRVPPGKKHPVVSSPAKAGGKSQGLLRWVSGRVGERQIGLQG